MQTNARGAWRVLFALFFVVAAGAEQIQVQAEWIAETPQQVQIAQQQASLENALVESMPPVYQALGVPADSGAGAVVSGQLRAISGPSPPPSAPPPPPGAPPPAPKAEESSDSNTLVIVAVVLGVVLVLGLVAWGVLRRPSAPCLPPPLPYKLLPQTPQYPQDPQNPRYDTQRYDPPRYDPPRYDPPPPNRPLPPTPPRYDPEPEECNRQQGQKMVHVVIRR